MGLTAWRSCSWLLALQQLGLSGSHTVPVAFFLPQTAVMGASRWWWLSSCSSCHLGSHSRSMEEKQEEPCVSAQL